MSRFVAPLTPTIKKYLAVKAKATINHPSSNPPSRPSSSQSTHSTLGLSQSAPLAPQAVATKLKRDVITSSKAPHVRPVWPDGGEPGPSRSRNRPPAAIVPATAHSINNAAKDSDIMPPPAVLPSHSRRDDAFGQHDSAPVSSSPHPSSSSEPLRPRTGPIRPAANQQKIVPTSHAFIDSSEQKRAAGGARRVLRPENSQTSSELPKDDHRTDGARCKLAVTARRADEVSSVTQRPASARVKQLGEKAAIPTQASRVVGKVSSATHAAASCTGNVPKRTGKTAARQDVGPSRSVPASSVQQHRPASKTTAHARTENKQQPKPVLKGKQPATSRAHTGSQPTIRAASPMRAVSPALVPLPRSPSRTPPQSPHSPPMTQRALFDAPQSSTISARSEPANAFNPSTPKGQSMTMQRKLIEQTPISALVESIERGFAFSPSLYSLPAADEGSSDESNMDNEPFPRTEPLTWNCNPLVVSKSSS